MTSETKRRALIDKWQAREAALCDELGNNEEKLADVTDALHDAQDALRTVKYWMHDVLYLNKPMSSPRAVLREVERALGEAS